MSDPRDKPEPATGDREPRTVPGRAAVNGSGAVAPTRQAVASQLKSLFAELTSGPMPDHLLALMDQLETAQESNGEEPAAGPPVR